MKDLILNTLQEVANEVASNKVDLTTAFTKVYGAHKDSHHETDNNENDYEEERPHREKNAAEESLKRREKKKTKKQTANKRDTSKPAMHEQKPCDNLSGERHQHTSTSRDVDVSRMAYTKLQEAIVLSEILGKPVSKQRRHRGR